MKNRQEKPNKIRTWASALWESLQNRVHRDVEAATEPIDFSSPSIPYYAGLANRFSLARTVLYVVLVLFLVVTILFNTEMITYQNLYYLAKDINAAALTAETPSDYIGYPVSSGEPDFALYRNGLVVAGGEEVTALSSSGKTTLSDNVSYADPCIRSSDAYFLTFGRGERTFHVYNAFLRVYTGDTDYPVYDACMASDGNFAILTRSREYKSEVTVYDRDFYKLASYRTNRYATGVALSQDGDRVAMVSTSTENGTAYSYLQIARPGRNKIDAEVRLDGVMLYRCIFLSSTRVAVIGDRGAWIYATDGKEVSRLALDGGEPVLYTVNPAGGQIAFLLQSQTDFSENKLLIFDRTGKTVHTISVELSTEALNMLWGDGAVYLRTADSVTKIPLGRGQTERLTIPANSYDMEITKDGSLLICTPSHAYRPADKDWVPVS